MEIRLVIYMLLRSLIIQAVALAKRTLAAPDLDTNGDAEALEVVLSHMEAANRQINRRLIPSRDPKPPDAKKP